MMIACTSARETNETNATVPNTIQSDADRRAIYNNTDSRPIPRPPGMNNQASEINRKKNIEDWENNEPSNEPIEVRTRELGRPRADTIR